MSVCSVACQWGHALQRQATGGPGTLKPQALPLRYSLCDVGLRCTLLGGVVESTEVPSGEYHCRNNAPFFCERTDGRPSFSIASPDLLRFVKSLDYLVLGIVDRNTSEEEIIRRPCRPAFRVMKRAMVADSQVIWSHQGSVDSMRKESGQMADGRASRLWRSTLP
jgi:hypothetical protein